MDSRVTIADGMKARSKQMRKARGRTPAMRVAAASRRSRTRDSDWDRVPAAFRSPKARLTSRWETLFGPLRNSAIDDLVVVAQMGQSLDGRIAAPTGHSHYINGMAGRTHLHRLRALVDAVVVGVQTVLADDPQLTVRLVRGPSPARVVLDPNGRMPANARVLGDDGARRLIITSAESPERWRAGIEIARLPLSGARFRPAAILAELAARGFRRILVEGGAATVSCFLAEHCLDRLHVVVAPMILGAGRAGLELPPIARVDDALRPPIRVHPLGDEVLFDCDLSATRIRIFCAKQASRSGARPR
jgi:diaminohydroxyphosphoribosylaminopyrimidine deaminase/5-amino-6-(5-phosphoribosylamino)uracil reductase